MTLQIAQPPSESPPDWPPDFLPIKPLEPVGKMDPGIQKAVDCLRAYGVETYESCEGGPGHSYPEPAVRFHGTSAAGWHALSVCIDFGLPVECLRRIWTVEHDREPVGPTWEIVFRHKL